MRFGRVICLTGGALEVATCGGYTFALGFHEAAGIALMTHGAAQASYHSRDIAFHKKTKKRSARPDPDPKAEGSPHTIIERPWDDGQYTTTCSGMFGSSISPRFKAIRIVKIWK